MSDNVISLHQPDGIVGDGTALDPDVILENAKGDYVQVVVLGFEHDGSFTVRTSHGSRDALWAIARAQHHVLVETRESERL